MTVFDFRQRKLLNAAPMTLLKQSFLSAALVAAVCAVCAARAPFAGAAEKAAAGSPPAAADAKTEALFDGKTLKGWALTDFAGKGKVSVTNGEIHLGMGYMTGVNYTSAVPRMNYEISLEAKRTEGSDFFCGLTFPVGTNYCSLIVGGWGGGVVGLSSIDGEDASQNETTKFMDFKSGQWYKIRLQVTPKKIYAWIDKDQMVDLETEDKRFSIRLEVESSTPLGIATWNTGAALRNLELKRL
jgi:hypothetical protein